MFFEFLRLRFIFSTSKCFAQHQPRKSAADEKHRFFFNNNDQNQRLNLLMKNHQTFGDGFHELNELMD